MMEKSKYKKVFVVNQVKFPKEEKSEKELDTNEVVSSLLSEMERLDIKENEIPSRDLKKIKHDRDAKKLAELAELVEFNGDVITEDDFKVINPVYKLEKLESEFFAAKQQLNKNIRAVENYKSRIYKLYQEIFPELSIENIKEKFTY